jgi:hypothetical protein
MSYHALVLDIPHDGAYGWGAQHSVNCFWEFLYAGGLSSLLLVLSIDREITSTLLSVTPVSQVLFRTFKPVVKLWCTHTTEAQYVALCRIGLHVGHISLLRMVWYGADPCYDCYKLGQRTLQ